MTLFVSAAAILFTLLGVAGWHDLRSRRIPNVVVMVGIAVGLCIQSIAPLGGGFFHPVSPGSLGLISGVLGAATGLALFMPFYLLRTLGAGDVKLLAMVGAWLGASSVAWVALWTLASGGLLAVIMMLGGGHSRRVLTNLRTMLTTSMIHVQSANGASTASSSITTGRLPYALAIAAGTLIEVGRHWV